MKKTGILNGELMKQITSLGHMELFLIGDAGMPIPPGVQVIDLALCRGIPSFHSVLDAILQETVVEYYYMAEEIQEKNPDLLKVITDSMPGLSCEMMPHTNLKEFSARCKFAVRTGECTPYPNVVLRAGVAF